MATTSSAALVRSILAGRSLSSLLISKRLFSSSSPSSSITKLPPISAFSRTARSVAFITHPLHSYFPSAVRMTSIRCWRNRSWSAYSPPNSGSTFGDIPTSEMAPLFPGCDYLHWLVVMDKPGGEGATKEEMIDCYVETLAKVLGTEKEARELIYNASFEGYFGFGCRIDEETATILGGLGIHNVLFVIPDSYVDIENKDYGAELLVNGEIVKREPERQRRVVQRTYPLCLRREDMQ